MKKLIKEIPVVSKIIFSISILIYLLTVIVSFFQIDLINFLGLYQFDNEKFNPLQILTFTFSHDLMPDHIIYNITFLLIFGVQCEFLLKKDFYKLILFTICLAILGLQFFDQSGKHLGLSIIGFSTISYFILSKNVLPVVLSTPLKILGLLFIFSEFVLFLKGYTNNVFDGNFHSSYAHMIGVLSGSIFYLYMKIKKGV